MKKLSLLSIPLLLAMGATPGCSSDEASGPGASEEGGGDPDPGPSHPNILLIVGDDLGWADVGYHGSEIRTPVIDGIVADGVALDRFYTFPLCGLTRKALATGRNPRRFGPIDNPQPDDDGALPLDEHVFAESFQAAGYQTWAVGKWHLGGHVDPSYLPTDRGFDHFYGLIGGGIDHYSHTDGRSGLDWQRNGVPVTEEGYATDLLVHEAVGLIQGRDPTRPFLLYLPFNAVHTPLQAPEAAIEEYADIADESRRIFAAMVTTMDAGIGQVLSTLIEESLVNDTLVVWMSDNGGDTTNAANNDPLRAGKGRVFEGGVRVSGAIRWPGVIDPGRVSSQLVSVMDLFPTLTSAAGIPSGAQRELDGADLWAVIRGDAEPVAPAGMLLYKGDDFAVYDGPWKLVHRDTADQNLLYAIDTDPLEEDDLAGENPEVVAALLALATRYD